MQFHSFHLSDCVAFWVISQDPSSNLLIFFQLHLINLQLHVVSDFNYPDFHYWMFYLLFFLILWVNLIINL